MTINPIDLHQLYPCNKYRVLSQSIRRQESCMDWVPTLTDRDEALTADIASGRLRRGQQLPTHRVLAKALGIDLTTVTRAYTEARQRGLTEARTGRGTFVAESMAHVRHATDPQAQIDLSMNLPRNRWENNERWRTMGNAI